MAAKKKHEYTEDKIKTLSSPEHIRLRTGMYIGRTGSGAHYDDGIYILVKEVIDNGIDEFIMGHGARIDVSIEEDITLGTGETCKVVAIGGQAVGPIDISNGSPYTVATTLAKDASLTTQVRCETNDNPLDNVVTARAKSIASAGTPDLSESYDMTAQQLCPLNVSPMIDVNKQCTDVRLTQVSGILTMEVEVDIDLKNTSDEKLESVLISNVIGDIVGGTPITLNHVDSNGLPLAAAFDGDLAPGETAYFKSTYVPSDVDGGIAVDNDTGDANFTDRVDASGVGAISGSTASDFSTATCPLCPPAD